MPCFVLCIYNSFPTDFEMQFMVFVSIVIQPPFDTWLILDEIIILNLEPNCNF